MTGRQRVSETVPIMVSISAPASLTSLATAKDLSLRFSQVPLSEDSVLTAVETDDLLPDVPWPGIRVQPQPDLPIDYQSTNLYDILQSVKEVLGVKQIRRRPKTGHAHISAPFSARCTVKSTTGAAQPLGASSGKRCFSGKEMDKHSPPPKTSASACQRTNRIIKQKQQSAISTPQPASSVRKYKPTDKNKVKRRYWQPWNEEGKLRYKNTSYIEIHYDDCMPPLPSDDMRLKPTLFARNHRHGEHWEVRYFIEEEKPKPTLKKVERIWENEFQIFKLDQMLDKKLTLNSSREQLRANPTEVRASGIEDQKTT